jgi:hypothetical protein
MILTKNRDYFLKQEQKSYTQRWNVWCFLCGTGTILKKILSVSASKRWQEQKRHRRLRQEFNTAGEDDVAGGVMGCDDLRPCRFLPTYLLLKMEAICSSETLLTTYKLTWRYSPQDNERRVP